MGGLWLAFQGWTLPDCLDGGMGMGGLPCEAASDWKNLFYKNKLFRAAPSLPVLGGSLGRFSLRLTSSPLPRGQVAGPWAGRRRPARFGRARGRAVEEKGADGAL